MLERRLEDPSYDSLTQLIKRKGKKEMNDVSNNNKDTEKETSNDAQVRPQVTPQVRPQVTWSNPVQQSVRKEMNDVSKDTEKEPSNDAQVRPQMTPQVRPQVTWSNPIQQSVQQRITYDDGEDITIASDISVKQPYIYKSYKDACTSNGSTNTRQSNIQVTSE